MGESCAEVLIPTGRPRGGERGCHRLETGEPCTGLEGRSADGGQRRSAREAHAGAGAHDEIELAAALVGAVAGVRAVPTNQPGVEFSDRTSAAWQEIEKRLQMVTKAAETLGSRLPRIRDPRLALSVARGLDALLRNIVAGHAALEVAICDCLAALEDGRRAMHLGYSSIGDYAREDLGMNASTAAKRARLARNLRDRPLVREALRRGEITLRKAEIILPVAVGDRQTFWILRAKEDTVRGLRKAVDAPRNPEDEEVVSLSFAVAAEDRPAVDEGLRWGGIVLGHRSTKAQRVEAWGQEYFGAHAEAADDGADPGADEVRFKSRAEEDNIESMKERLERESRLWADLVAVDPLQAVDFSGEIDPWRVDAEVKRLVEMRNRWDDVFGHVALLFKRSGAWEPLEFTDFSHYCEERLGMGRRTVAQRVALERSLCRIPLLRQALREKRISYEKARLIARHCEAGHVQELRPLIAKAETMTCIDLRESLEVKAEEQMCARGVFTFIAEPDILELLKDTFRAFRVLAKRAISAGKCLAEMAAHFVAVWKAHVKERMTRSKRIFARGRHRCQVPGCSRLAVHAHHIEFRAHGGSDDDSNLIGLCAAHHQHGIHDGLMRVSGTAPDKLVWEFGLRRSWVETAVP
jgi:hypothetical protein